MKRKYLMTPGPSPVPAFVREALAREIIHHRTDEFREILARVHSGLQYVFCTQDPVLMFAASGTGAMEASMVNFLSAEDTVVVVNGGKFGERWVEIAQSYKVNVIEYKLAWGTAPDADYIRDLLKEHKRAKAIYATLCETSTGTAYDIEAIAKVTRDRDVFLVVDAISGLGQDKLLAHTWGVDIVVSGSQKGFMLPPGLAFLSVSEKAKQYLNSSTLPKYYFDVSKALKSYAKNDTPYTPAVSLIVGLESALSRIKEEKIERRWEKFALLARATQEAAKALGLQLFSRRPSHSVTAIVAPPGIKSSDLVKKLRKEEGLSIASGQADVKDKIFRIAHMGWINEQDLIMCFSLVEKALKSLGCDLKLGTALQTLQEVLYA